MELALNILKKFNQKIITMKSLSTRILNRIKRFFGPTNPLGSSTSFEVPKEILEYDKIEGFLSPREAAALFYYASKVNIGGNIVEVGSWKGKSTFCLARGLSNGKVFAIDPFDASGEPGSAETYKKQKGESELLSQFKERMTELGVIEKIQILQGYSGDFKDKFEKIDLLFIDGDHSIKGCKADFDYFSNAIVPGGYILFHDYDPAREELGPTWVIKNLIINRNVFEYVALADSMWIGRKK